MPSFIRHDTQMRITTYDVRAAALTDRLHHLPTHMYASYRLHT